MDSVLESAKSYPISSVLVGITAFVVAYWFLSERRHRRNLPSGPPRLPFIGTLPFHGFTPKEFTKLGEKYGDIFMIYIGSTPCVILNTYELMREAFVNKAQHFSGRGDGYIQMLSNPHKLGIVDAEYSPEMRRHRNHALGTFRTLGFGKPLMESKIVEETEILARIMEGKNGKEFNPGPMLSVTVTNVINSVLYNTRYEHDDKAVLEVIEHSETIVKAGFEIIVIDIIPLLRWLPNMKREVKKFMNAHDSIMEFTWKGIQEHLDSHSSGLDSDFIHTLIEKNLDAENSDAKLDKDNMHYMVRDFFIAGMETTATSTKWMLLLMANYPGIQAKAHEELDRVVGKDRPVRMSDREQLNYIEAIIWEIQRRQTIVPFSVQHYTETDATLAGYDIPAGTIILPNIECVHMNPATWKNPKQFLPERFLNADGRFERHPHLIPFSMGKRQCLGEVLARQELFLLTASLLQRFTFLPPEGMEKLPEDGIFGSTHAPKPFTIRAILR